MAVDKSRIGAVGANLIIETMDLHFRVLDRLDKLPMMEAENLRGRNQDLYQHFLFKIFLEAMQGDDEAEFAARMAHRSSGAPGGYVPAEKRNDPKTKRGNENVVYRKGYKNGWKHHKQGTPIDWEAAAREHPNDPSYVEGLKQGFGVRGQIHSAVTKANEAHAAVGAAKRNIGAVKKRLQDYNYDPETHKDTQAAKAAHAAAVKNYGEAHKQLLSTAVLPHAMTIDKLGTPLTGTESAVDSWTTNFDPSGAGQYKSNQHGLVNSLLTNTDAAVDDPANEGHNDHKYHPADIPQMLAKASNRMSLYKQYARSGEAGAFDPFSEKLIVGRQGDYVPRPTGPRKSIEGGSGEDLEAAREAGAEETPEDKETADEFNIYKGEAPGHVEPEETGEPEKPEPEAEGGVEERPDLDEPERPEPEAGDEDWTPPSEGGEDEAKSDEAPDELEGRSAEKTNIDAAKHAERMKSWQDKLSGGTGVEGVTPEHLADIMKYAKTNSFDDIADGLELTPEQVKQAHDLEVAHREHIEGEGADKAQADQIRSGASHPSHAEIFNRLKAARMRTPRETVTEPTKEGRKPKTRPETDAEHTSRLLARAKVGPHTHAAMDEKQAERIANNKEEPHDLDDKKNVIPIGPASRKALVDRLRKKGELEEPKAEEPEGPEAGESGGEDVLPDDPESVDAETGEPGVEKPQAEKPQAEKPEKTKLPASKAMKKPSRAKGDRPSMDDPSHERFMAEARKYMDADPKTFHTAFQTKGMKDKGETLNIRNAIEDGLKQGFKRASLKGLLLKHGKTKVGDAEQEGISVNKKGGHPSRVPFMSAYHKLKGHFMAHPDEELKKHWHEHHHLESKESAGGDEPTESVEFENLRFALFERLRQQLPELGEMEIESIAYNTALSLEESAQQMNHAGPSIFDSLTGRSIFDGIVRNESIFDDLVEDDDADDDDIHDDDEGGQKNIGDQPMVDTGSGDVDYAEKKTDDKEEKSESSVFDFLTKRSIFDGIASD